MWQKLFKALLYLLGFFGLFGVVGMCYLALRSTGKVPPRPDLQLDALIAERDYPGRLSILVTRNQRNSTHLIYDKHWPADSGANGQTSYDLGSLDEALIAMAVMTLHDRKKLDFDQPIGELAPEIPAPLHGITARQLLTRRSGIDPAVEDVMSIRQIDPEASDQGRYAFADYDLLWRLVERVSGKPAHEYIREAVLEPVETSCIRFEAAEPEPGDRLAQSRGGRWLGCADDLRKWDLALNSNLLVRFRTMKPFLIPPRDDEGARTRFAFGWEIMNRKGLRVELWRSHERAAACLLKLSQKDFSIVILSDMSHEQLNAAALAMDIVDIYLGREMPQRYVSNETGG